MLRLEDIEQVKNGVRIIRGVNLEMKPGSFFILMGPTGCGKTTLLRIAGLIDRPARGRVLLDGVPASPGKRSGMRVRRDVVTLFQNPVLFGGTVRSNIEWGLKLRGVKTREAGRRTDEILDTLNLSHLSLRNVSTLSGGEIQRTALARALVLKPRILLLDEPTTSADPELRKELVREISGLHRKWGAIFVMATHDFTEALSLGTHGAVMKDGRVEQAGAIDDLFRKPESPFTAAFVGLGNVFKAKFSGGKAMVNTLYIHHPGDREGSGYLAVPKESVTISLNKNSTSERNRFPGRVVSITGNGSLMNLEVDCAGVLFVSSLTEAATKELALEPGREVWVSFKASSVRTF